MIDFTMNGINICLLIGIVLLLQGICFLFMQNPFKNIKKFGVRELWKYNAASTVAWLFHNNNIC